MERRDEELSFSHEVLNLLCRSVVLERTIEGYAITGQYIESVQLEEALHTKAIARRNNDGSSIGALALFRLELVDVVIVCSK